MLLKVQNATRTLLEMVWLLSHVGLILSGWQGTVSDALEVKARLESLSSPPSMTLLHVFPKQQTI
jgi:hypothetical protein